MSETMTPTEAAALVEADKQQRLQAFGKAIEQAAQEYRCDLAVVVVPSVTPDGTVKINAQIQVVAK